MSNNPTINNLQPETGREYKEDGTVVNTADLMVTLVTLFQNAKDPINGLFVVNEFQNATHLGQTYSFSSYGTIANGSSITLLGRVGAKQIHFDGMDIQLASGGILMEMLEAPTISTLGTSQTVRRRNRAVGTTGNNTMLVYSGSAVTGGTLIDTAKPPIVTSNGQRVEGATTGIGEGWILKQNTDYAIRLTNNTGAAVDFNASFAWHESSIILS